MKNIQDPGAKAIQRNNKKAFQGKENEVSAPSKAEEPYHFPILSKAFADAGFAPTIVGREKDGSYIFGRGTR